MKTTKLFASMFMAMAVAFSACTNVNDPDDDNPGTKLPFSEKFDTGLGSFTVQNVSGEQVWEFSSQYKYALISGYVNQTNNANEDWLISPEIDLAGVSAAKLTFEHASRYFGSIGEEATLWVSENYVSGLPATATWTKLVTPAFKDAGSWTMVSSGEISLTAYAGKKIKIAFKYVSTSTKAGTWQLKNFLIEEGEATVDPDPTVTGDGTKAKPYSVEDVIILNPSSTTEAVKTAVWTKGFIVGYYNSTPNPAVVEAVAPFTDDVNVMLASNAGETDKAKMLSVQLPAGAVRTALGLKTTPANFGKEILVYGDIMKYNTFPGVKNTAAYWFVAENIGIEPPASGDFGVPEMSIADVRAQWTGEKKTITDKKKIVGIVVSDLVGGNSGSLKNLTIVSTDNSAGIMVRLTEDNKYNMGDKIEIALDGLELNQYGLAIQLNNVPSVKTQRVATNQTVTPVATTIANVRANYASFESRLVTVNGTITSGGGGKWYSGTTAGQNNKLTSGSDELVLYVTKYATFKDSTTPAGEKSVTGIVGQYSTAAAATYQLIIRNLDDVK